MNEKLIIEFKEYFQNSKPKNIVVTSTSSNVGISTSILNDRFLIDIALVFLMFYGTYNIDDKSFYLIPIFAAWIVLVIVIWSDFNRINKIKVSLTDKTIEIISRNILKRIFSKRKKYDFAEINSFIVHSNFASKADSKKYFVDARLGNKTSLLLTFFTKEEQANRFVGFMTNLLKE